jgi:hypothetical protein
MRSFPPLNAEGDLPAGIHLSSLMELGNAFGSISRERHSLFQRIARIYGIAKATGHLARFVVFGSFVSDKPVPNDVDVFMVFGEYFDASSCSGEALILLDHAKADAYFGASVFWLRRPAALDGEQASIEFWQTKRDGRQRGIIEIEESNDDRI